MFGFLYAYPPPPPAKPTINMVLFKSEDSTGTIVIPFLLFNGFSFYFIYNILVTPQ
jgi:hypothetical protein